MQGTNASDRCRACPFASIQEIPSFASPKQIGKIQKIRQSMNLSQLMTNQNTPRKESKTYISYFGSLERTKEYGQSEKSINLRTAQKKIDAFNYLSLLEINKNWKMNTWKEVPVDERIIPPFVLSSENIVLPLLRDKTFVGCDTKVLISGTLELERVFGEYCTSPHRLHANKGTE